LNARHFIIATAGHVDHGKSSLVKALTGVDPDRLPEEKARGITIDLGFAHLEIPGSVIGDPSLTFRLGIVDVPGHEDFVKNMVAGVGSIDVALFVVAADDGWMPQTEEHLQILSYLGVTRAVVVITKMDLVAGKESDVMEQLRKKLEGTVFAEAPIVMTSVVRGEGLEEFKKALAQVLLETPPPTDIGKPRLPVDRVFTLHGIGTVITGTLTGGTLRRGQEIVIQPSGTTTRVRSIQSHNQDVELSSPGTRTAINLPDIAVAGKDPSAQSGKTIRRGDILTLKEFGSASRVMDVVLERSPRSTSKTEGESRPIKNAGLVRFHHCSGNCSARVLILDGDQVVPGQKIPAQLRLETPVFAFAGDRFILRDWSEQMTLAGGMILDPDAGIRNLRSEARKIFLKQRGDAPDQVSVFVSSQLMRDGIVVKSGLLRKSHFSPNEIADAIARLVKDGRAVGSGDFVADKDWWQKLCQRAIDMIETEHKAHPEQGGVPLSKLRVLVEKGKQPADIFDAVVADLCKADFVQTSGNIRRKTHQATLPPNLQAPVARLHSALMTKPLDPPSRKELVAGTAGEQALRFLIETGEAVKVSDDVILLVESLAKATEIIRKFLTNNKTATVSELRQTVGTSRRIIVPLLEHLDRQGITLRQGDQRVLRNRV